MLIFVSAHLALITSISTENIQMVSNKKYHQALLIDLVRCFHSQDINRITIKFWQFVALFKSSSKERTL